VVFRETSRYYYFAPALFLSLWIGTVSFFLLFSLLHRGWEWLEESSLSPRLVLLLWRWLHQVKYTYCQSAGTVLGGNVLLNLFLSLAGSEVSPSAVILNTHLNDWSKYQFGAYALVNDNAFPFGHLLSRNTVSFGKLAVKERAAMLSFSVLLPGQRMGAGSVLGSHVTAWDTWGKGRRCKARSTNSLSGERGRREG
jgi:hypothetical protein